MIKMVESPLGTKGKFDVLESTLVVISGTSMFLDPQAVPQFSPH